MIRPWPVKSPETDLCSNTILLWMLGDDSLGKMLSLQAQRRGSMHPKSQPWEVEPGGSLDSQVGQLGQTGELQTSA